MAGMIFSSSGSLSMAFFQIGWAVLYRRINRADNSPVAADASETI